MNQHKVSRREFGVLLGAGAATLAAGELHAADLTAGEVIARVRSHLGIPWNDKTYRDTIKIGGPDIIRDHQIQREHGVNVAAPRAHHQPRKR